MSDHVTAVGYLVIEADPVGATVRDRAKITRVTARPPYMQGTEVAVRVSVRIPKSVFAAALAEVAIDVPESLVSTPVVSVEAIGD